MGLPPQGRSKRPLLYIGSVGRSLRREASDFNGRHIFRKYGESGELLTHAYARVCEGISVSSGAHFSAKKRKGAVTPVISGDPVVFSTRGGASKTENVVFVMEGGLQENGLPL